MVGQSQTQVAGLVLAAGEGRRFGGPKVLVPGWISDRVQALRDGGCSAVVVVVGAAAHAAAALVPADVVTVVARDWSDGMGASLRAGLEALVPGTADAAIVALVDTPGLTPAAVTRVLDCAGRNGDAARAVLAQAVYAGRPGHPVLLGRSHWHGVMEQARGDRGARDYLAARGVERVECGDVADGDDVDVAPPLYP